MGRSLPRSSPRTSEWAVPRVAGRFSDSETSWVLAGGSEDSFLCSLSSRFSGRGGGVGSLPRAWRRVGVPVGAAGAKKNCEIGVGFSFAALSVFRLRRAEAASAVWIPHSLGAFRIARDAGGEAVREREPRRAGEGRESGSPRPAAIIWSNRVPAGRNSSVCHVWLPHLQRFKKRDDSRLLFLGKLIKTFSGVFGFPVVVSDCFVQIPSPAIMEKFDSRPHSPHR